MGETLPEIFEGIQSAAYEFTSPDWDKVSKDAKGNSEKIFNNS